MSAPAPSEKKDADIGTRQGLAKLLRGLDAFSGLRGVTVIYTYFNHWHLGWPAFLHSVFTRQIDMKCFFILMGCITYIQHHKSDWHKNFFSFWLIQFKKLFPVYWIALLAHCVWMQVNGHGGEMSPSVQPTAYCIMATVSAMQVWYTLFDEMCWFETNHIFWFITTTWSLLLATPVLVSVIKQTCTSHARAMVATGFCIVANFILNRVTMAYTDEINTVFGQGGTFAGGKQTPFVTMWPFCTGMCIGSLLLHDVNWPSQKRWGLITDATACILAFLTFGPSLRLNPLRFSFEYPEWGRPEEAQDEDMVAAMHAGDTVRRYYPDYPFVMDRNLYLPAQIVTLALFVYGLGHGEGLCHQVLRAKPLNLMGRCMFGFYCFHDIVTRLILGYTDNEFWGIVDDIHAPHALPQHRVFMLCQWSLSYIPCICTTFCIAWFVHSCYEPAAIACIDDIVDYIRSRRNRKGWDVDLDWNVDADSL